MSQRQPQRSPPQQPVTHSDVFINVEGELAQHPVAPRDSAMMQTAETTILGQTKKGGAAGAMQQVAARNERGGFVGHDRMNNAAADGGVAITETDLPGRRVIREEDAGQVLGELSQPTPLAPPSAYERAMGGGGRGITIGEALEATGMTAGKKPVEWSDAAAIQAAEVRATGRTNIVPGGAAAARSRRPP